MTTLTGNNVTINVDGKTTITGGMVAAGNYDEQGQFTDNGRLTLTTNELEYNHINDLSVQTERGLGFDGTYGTIPKSSSTYSLTGTTSVTTKNTGYEREGVTNATIGQGTIVVGGQTNPELDGLNRDTSNAQEITKDLITNELNATWTVDNQMLTERPIDMVIKDPWSAPFTGLGLVNGLANILYGDVTKGEVEKNPVKAWREKDGSVQIKNGQLDFVPIAPEFQGKVEIDYVRKEPK